MEFIRENFVKIILFLGGLIIAIIIFSLLFGRRGIANKVTYTTLEQRMVQAAKKYANDNKKILPTKENETNKIRNEYNLRSANVHEGSSYLETLAFRYQKQSYLYMCYL